MENGLITCRSLTGAQKLARLAQEAGCPAVVAQVPRELMVTGCGYCVRVPERCLAKVYGLMRRNGISEGRVFRRVGRGYEAVVI